MSGSRSKCSHANSAAGPAESARDFIGDEQRAVTAAEVAYPPDDVFLWNQDAEIDADRLHDERGDVAPLQPLLDPAQRLRVERRCDLAAVRQQVLDVLAVVGRADAQPGKRVAVLRLLGERGGDPLDEAPTPSRQGIALRPSRARSDQHAFGAQASQVAFDMGGRKAQGISERDDIERRQRALREHEDADQQ